jgi:uncharacterized protein (TIGR00297 family)
MVASFAAKLADTTSSEIGKAYGKRTFLITSLQSVPPGTEGAVSLEGTTAGILASGFLAMLAFALRLVSLKGALVVAFAAFFASTAESFIGAIFQTADIKWLTNELVNLIMTVIGAAAAWGLMVALA